MDRPARRRARAILPAAVLLTLAASALPSAQIAPPPAAPESEPPGEGANGVCGTERWNVKTLSDPDAQQVNMTPQQTTIAQLTALPAPATDPPRRLQAELQVWQIDALVTEMRLESDHDYHVVVVSRDDPSQHMIVEVPDPACPGANGSAFANLLANARASFERQFGSPPAYPQPFLKLATPIPVVVTGVGFFDRIHGQQGVAPNGIELHPVVTIQKSSQP